MESYNGILLCKRPLPGKNVPQRNGLRSPKMIAPKLNSKLDLKKSTDHMYWKPGGGGSTNIPEKSKVVTRISKNDGALRRHKLWLKQMQEKKEEQIKLREVEERLKEEKKQDFMSKQAKKRARARGQDPNIDNCSIDDDKSNSHHHMNGPLGDAISGEKRSRPAWSLTEADADYVSKSMNIQEEQELMNYVDDLDFESLYGDMELKVLMGQVKDRIRVLETGKKIDESKLRAVMESEIASARNDKLNNSDFLFDTQIMHEGKMAPKQCDDLQSIAETIRSESSSSVSTIHSRKSLQMMVSKAKERLATVALGSILECSDSKGAEVAMALPLTITHKEDDGARLKETKSLNKLPFKNRNPAL